MHHRAELSLKGRALRCLATREHSRAELERKLREFETSPGELAQVLDALAAKGFISEQRVAESVVNRRAGKLGGQRLRQELQAKGLAPELVAQTLGDLRASEQARAYAVWRSKFGQHAADAAGRARQMRFLQARGFAAEVVRRVVGGNPGETE
jgi:regulatory protein